MQALFQSAQHIYEKREGSGSVPLTKGSGSGRPKNMRILRIWFRIPHTGIQFTLIQCVRGEYGVIGGKGASDRDRLGNDCHKRGKSRACQDGICTCRYMRVCGWLPAGYPLGVLAQCRRRSVNNKKNLVKNIKIM